MNFATLTCPSNHMTTSSLHSLKVFDLLKRQLFKTRYIFRASKSIESWDYYGSSTDRLVLLEACEIGRKCHLTTYKRSTSKIPLHDAVASGYYLGPDSKVT